MSVDDRPEGQWRPREQFGPAILQPSSGGAPRPVAPPPLPEPAVRDSLRVASNRPAPSVPAGPPLPVSAPAQVPAQAPVPAPAGGDPPSAAPSSGAPVGPTYGTVVAPPRPRDRATVRRSTAVLAVLLALLAGLLLGGLGERFLFADGNAVNSGAPSSQSPLGTVAPQAITGPDPLAVEYSVADIAERVMPSTVYIEATDGPRGASGTGAVMSADGFIVTNQHVVAIAADRGRITVTFSDGSVEDAEIVAATEDYDLAVLWVDRTDLTPLPFADSDGVRVGDPVVAVGAPLGLEGTVTSGIVSALNRAVTAGDITSVSYINAIQTDAAINPGNSGGPLVNSAGELIGINTAIAQGGGASSATGSIGLGFAIPSNQVARTTEQLITQGFTRSSGSWWTGATARRACSCPWTGARMAPLRSLPADRQRRPACSLAT